MDKREIRQMMELLQIEDVTTKRQLKNGTITWRLPIKIGSGNRCIEVGSFKSGYIRNNNCGYSNYQLNKRCENEPEYFPVYKWVDGKQIKTDKYRKWTTRGCILIPNELERLEYLIKYCLKNYYIKHANFVANGEYVHKWTHEWELKQSKDKYNNLADAARLDYERRDSDVRLKEKVRDLENKLDTIQRVADHE